MKSTVLYKFLIISFLLSAPVVVKAQSAPQKAASDSSMSVAEFFDSYLKGYYSQVFNVNPSDILNINLYSSIEKWLGTPYRYAGSTVKGIDCSAFVNKIYESAYCFLLDGNSNMMYRTVKHLPKSELKEGDLVFFKTTKNKTVSHVGVYLGNNKFAHASRSKGVTVSDLTHPYYERRFVKGGRVEFQIN